MVILAKVGSSWLPAAVALRRGWAATLCKSTSAPGIHELRRPLHTTKIASTGRFDTPPARSLVEFDTLTTMMLNHTSNTSNRLDNFAILHTFAIVFLCYVVFERVYRLEDKIERGNDQLKKDLVCKIEEENAQLKKDLIKALKG